MCTRESECGCVFVQVPALRYHPSAQYCTSALLRHSTTYEQATTRFNMHQQPHTQHGTGVHANLSRSTLIIRHPHPPGGVLLLGGSNLRAVRKTFQCNAKYQIRFEFSTWRFVGVSPTPGTKFKSILGSKSWEDETPMSLLLNLI